MFVVRLGLFTASAWLCNWRLSLKASELGNNLDSTSRLREKLAVVP